MTTNTSPSDRSTDTYTIRGASLPTEPSDYGFAEAFSGTARAFQNRVADWIHDRDADAEPVAVLRAPTSSGKTATFDELISASGLTLLVYPTNALLQQQRDRFAHWNVKELTSDALEHHGRARLREIKRKANQFTGDVIVTNPDILQWIVQGGYWGSDDMEFFDRFNAVVYDEFHFYGPLSVSGLLLQTRVIADRNPNARILLASATPNDALPVYIHENFDIPVRDIAPTVIDGVGGRGNADSDPFRRSVDLTRCSEQRILDDRDRVADRLRAALDEHDPEPDEVCAAVVFNSVRDSNVFHGWLADANSELARHTAKDNGYDTNDPDHDLCDREFSILNTTSKGEVGLDYDIRTLIMETPRGQTAAADFLQRFGRAGRQSPAEVDVYGNGAPRLRSGSLSFDEFTDRVYTTLTDSAMDQNRLADLVAMRAAFALYERDRSSTWYNEELRKDFASVARYENWRDLIEELDTTIDTVGDLGSDIHPTDREAWLLQFTRHCFDALRGLRGRSLSGSIRYPRGDRMALTTYSLLSSLRYYDITGVEQGPDDDPVLVLGRVRDQPRALAARFPGYETESRNIGNQEDSEEKLSRWIHREIRNANLDDTPVSTDLLHRFFACVRITDVAVPVRLYVGEYRIEVDIEGIPSVEQAERVD